MATPLYKLLIVDDSVMIINRLYGILSELNCIGVIGKAKSFNEAIIELNKLPYDIVLLDINLQGKNGIELLTFIKGNYPSIKIIMLSNQADEYYRKLCSNLGSDHFMDKSIEFESIPQIIKGYLNVSG